MKKFALLLVSVVLICVFCIGVSAEFLPIKDIYLVDEYGNNALVLMYSGHLLFGETEKKEPVVVAENVYDITFPENWPVETAVVKFNNGSIALLKYDKRKNAMAIDKPCAQNVNTVIGIPKSETNFEYLYIDNEGNLKGRRYSEDITVMTDVVSSKYSSDFLYMLNSSGEFFKVNSRSDRKNRDLLSTSHIKLADDVKGFTVNGKDCAYITKSNDLYVLKERAESGEKIASGISFVSKVILDGDSCFYLNDAGTAYLYKLRVKDKNEAQFTIKLSENISKFYVRNGSVYLVDKNNNCYTVTLGEKGTASLISYAKGVSKFFDGVVDLYENTDGKLMGVTKYNDEVAVYDISGISSVKPANKNQKWFIIRNNGEVLMAEGGVRSLTKIKLAPICDKRTKLFLNGKEAHLQSPVQIVNERSMYPLRECMEMLGAEILWDDVIKTAIAKLDGKRVEFPVGKKEYVANGQRIVVDDIAAYVDTSVNLTFVPIRYAAEALGFTVGWEQGITYNSITISK